MRTLPGNRLRLDRFSRLSQRLYRGLDRASFLPSSRRYNITVSHESRFLWYRVAKVGTRTIFYLFKAIGVRLDAEHAMRVYYAPRQYRSYFKFAFVRNPWDRLVSCWSDKVLGKNHFKFGEARYGEMKEFGAFVDYVSGLEIEECNQHLRLQCRLIDLNQIDYLGRLETFDSDFAHICTRVGVNVQEVSPLNVSTGREPYRHYYDEGLCEQVRQIYLKDIQVFGYSF